jgi:hypothetical protein
MKLFLFFLISLNYSFAQESYISYCFKTDARAQAVIKDVEFIKLPQDRIRLNRKCIEIFSSGNRTEFLGKYITQKFKDAQQSMSIGSQATPQTCRLEMTKVYQSQVNQQDINVSKNPKLAKTVSQKQQTQSQFIALQSGRKGVLQADGSFIYVTCTKKNKAYQISFSGSDSEQSYLGSVTLSLGQKTEVASFFKKAQESRKTNSLNKVAREEDNSASANKIFIRVVQ